MAVSMEEDQMPPPFRLVGWIFAPKGATLGSRALQFARFQGVHSLLTHW